MIKNTKLRSDFIWVYLEDLLSDQMIEYGEVLPKSGNEKKWFISRSQSYHGSGSDAISVGDRPNLNIYKSFFPKHLSLIHI